MGRKFFSTIGFLLFLLSLSAKASIILIDEEDFIPTSSESFETQGIGLTPSESVLDGHAIMTGSGEFAANEFYITDNWGFEDEDAPPFFWPQMLAQSGQQLAAIYGNGFVMLDFNVDVFAFGGYFGDAFLGQDTRIEFFDAANNLMDFFEIDFKLADQGNLVWAGFASSTAISSVKILGNQTAMDSLKISTSPVSVPEPSTISVLLLSLLGFRLLARKKAK